MGAKVIPFGRCICPDLCPRHHRPEQLLAGLKPLGWSPPRVPDQHPWVRAIAELERIQCERGLEDPELVEELDNAIEEIRLGARLEKIYE